MRLTKQERDSIDNIKEWICDIVGGTLLFASFIMFYFILVAIV